MTIIHFQSVIASAGGIGVLGLNGFSVNDTVSGGARDAFASVIIRSDGTTDSDDGANGVVQQNASTDWIIPNFFGGGDYEVQATLSFGNTPDTGPALSTWHNLATTRTWTNTRTTGEGVGSDTSTLSITIREVADTSNSVTNTYTITAAQI